tara:strand:- start:876 stop:1772 length:897 start_codon:yes stop_codon:yes gene_type:complete
MFDLIKFILEVIKRKVIIWHYNAIKHTHKKSFSPYLKYNDTITDAWYIFKDYQKNINNFIDNYAKKGYQDFFLDIGANIGLTTIANWKKFDNIYCIEPNDLVFNILKTNITISCDKEKVKLFNVGLGLKTGKYMLKIPKHNFGGAFIEENNEYTSTTLLEKEGFHVEKDSNYIDTEVNIESEDFLNENIFNKFKADHKGVIKIDVEGYELQVLELILNTINVNKIVIIFESWQTIDREVIEKMIKKNNFVSFKIGYSKWLSSFIEKIKLKSIYSDIIFLDDNENYIPKKCDVVIELEK